MRTRDFHWVLQIAQGFPKRYAFTKTPLLFNDGSIVGTAGVVYPVLTSADREAYYHELAPVISHIETHFRSELSMKEMAAMAKLSSTQFNVRFRELLRMSPSEYILKLRIEIAQKLLNASNKSIAEVAAESGFYDQSHFTKRYRKVTGTTPLAYRKQFR